MKRQLLLVSLILISASAQSQVYDSLNATLLSNWYNPAQSTASAYGIKYNGIWGWANSSGQEYAIICSASGTYFIDVTDPANPVERDYVSGVRDNCIWREVKTYQNYCYVVSDDSEPNSFQIIDMSYLPDSVHVVYNSDALFARAHTLYIDGDKLYAGYVKGGSVFFAPMAVFSLANPANPVLLRNIAADFSIPQGQVHDMLVRNDTVYASCGYDGLYIFTYDAVANQFSYVNSLTTYIDQGYNHSSALTDDGNHLYFTDEVPDGMDIKTLDVSNLSNLTVVDNFHSHDDATPHNPFIKGNYLYMAYYMDGLQVFDISDPTHAVRVAYFDTYHQNLPGNYPSPGFAGAWGAYPWLPSGNIIVSDMQNGLYVIDIDLPTSLEEREKESFILSPNPASANSGIRISGWKKSVPAFISIYDATGKKVYQTQCESETCTLPKGILTAGLYVVSLQAGEYYQSKKLVIVN